MIEENVKEILNELPDGVTVVAAAKTRTPAEIKRAVDAGIKIIGENYVQEAQKAFNVLGDIVKWHFIGHLQRNKVKYVVKFFDMIETVDSPELAGEINKRSYNCKKIMPVMIEINSGREKQKFGVLPDEVEDLIRVISLHENINLCGLMTMGPMFGDPENARPYFIETREVFEHIRSINIPGVSMKYLSM